MTSDTADGYGDARQAEPRPDLLQVRTRSPWPARLAWVVGLLAVAGVVGYVTAHPDELATSQRVVNASTPVGQSVYLGVFATGADFDRKLDVSGIKIFASSTVPVTITPHLCRGGSLSVTSQPDLFCSELVDTEGATMGAGDGIVLEVRGDEAGVVSIERIRVAYRDGLQRATQFAGSPALVTILSR